MIIDPGFNISYSALSTYISNPRLFYYRYILKLEPTDETNQTYALAGNTVHPFLEGYAEGKKLDFEKMWNKNNLFSLCGFNNKPLNFLQYKNCTKKGLFIVDMYKELGYELITERKFEIPYKNIIIKGFIDLILKKGDKVIILDWKTNSKVKSEYIIQQKMYVWAYYKLYNTLPVQSKWEYLKVDKTDKNKFTLEDISVFESYLYKTIDEILAKGDNIDEFPINPKEISNPFNGYKSLMVEKKPKEPLELFIDDSNIYLSGPPLTREFERTLADHFSYKLKNAFFIVKALAAKGVQSNGMKYFYNVNKKSLPIGFYHNLLGLLKINKIKHKIRDKRKLLRKYNMPQRLNDIVLRDYQNNAVEFALDKKITFLTLATSAGKTAIAAELIRRLGFLTIFVVDRNVLLSQTKLEFENMLGLKIGTITEGEINLEVVNIATIQTLNALIKKGNVQLRRILANVGLMIYDEGHTVAAKSFIKVSKRTINAEYIVGMSGTYERDDGNTMMIESVCGQDDFKKTAKELIDEDYIMKPDIYFFKYKSTYLPSSKYNEVYDNNIVNNEDRNKLLLDLVDRFKDKVKMIIITKIKHGELLQKQIKDSVFIQGVINGKIRDEWIDKARKGEIKTIIGTASIIQKGLNIKNLEVAINASCNDNSITTIQFLGRALRKCEGKNKAIYIDFYDKGKHIEQHTLNRIQTLKNQGHKVRVLINK